MVKDVNVPIIVTKTHHHHSTEHSGHMYPPLPMRIGMMTRWTVFQTHNSFYKKHVTYMEADIIYTEMKRIFYTCTT